MSVIVFAVLHIDYLCRLCWLKERTIQMNYTIKHTIKRARLLGFYSWLSHISSSLFLVFNSWKDLWVIKEWYFCWFIHQKPSRLTRRFLKNQQATLTKAFLLILDEMKNFILGMEELHYFMKFMARESAYVTDNLIKTTRK